MGRVITIRPNSDVANSGTKVGASTYFGCVSQDPHDSDTTRIGSLGAGAQNIFGCDWSVVEPDEIVTSIVVRWAESGVNGQDLQASAGLRVGGVYKSGPIRQISAGFVYASNAEPFDVNPVTGLPWVTEDVRTILQLMHRQETEPDTPTPGRPRLTQLVADVYLEGPVDQVDGFSGGVRGTASGDAATAAGATLSPAAAAASGAPTGRGTASTVYASAAATPPSASGRAGGVLAIPAPPGAISASGSSGAPRAEAASAAPTASGSAPNATRGDGE